MPLIDVPNLQGIEPMEGYFYMVQKFFKSCAKKKKVKKMGQFLEVYILRTTDAISFKFVTYSHVYVEHKICKFGRNPPSSLTDTRG